MSLQINDRLFWDDMPAASSAGASTMSGEIPAIEITEPDARDGSVINSESVISTDTRYYKTSEGVLHTKFRLEAKLSNATSLDSSELHHLSRLQQTSSARESFQESTYETSKLTVPPVKFSSVDNPFDPYNIVENGNPRLQDVIKLMAQVEMYRNLAEDNQKQKAALSTHCDRLEKDLREMKEKVAATENEMKGFQSKLLNQVEQRGALLESLIKKKEVDLDLQEMLKVKDKLVLSLQEKLDVKEKENDTLQSKLNSFFSAEVPPLGADKTDSSMGQARMIEQFQDTIKEKDILIQEKDKLLSKYQIETSTGDEKVEELLLQKETLAEALKENANTIEELQKENSLVKTVAELRYNDLMTERKKTDQIKLELNAVKEEKRSLEEREKSYISQISQQKLAEANVRSNEANEVTTSDGFYEQFSSGGEHSDEYKKSERTVLPKKKGFWSRIKKDKSRTRKNGVVAEDTEYQSIYQYTGNSEYPNYISD